MVLACLAAAPPAMAVGEPTPDPSSPPTVSGAARWGATLTSTPGGWTTLDPPFPISGYDYQWLRCETTSLASCGPIPSALAASYGVAGPDVGSRLRVRVHASNANGRSEQPAYSSPTAAVVEDPPNNTARPTFTGVARQGEILTRSSYGVWASPTPTGYSVEWLRCNGSGAGCSEIPAASADAYELDAGDVGSTIRLRVRADGPFGDTSASSAPSAVVAGRAPESPTARRKARRLSPFPRILIAGSLSPGGAVFRRVVVRGPRNVTVRIRCRGLGCGLRKRSYRMRRRKLRIRALERNFRSGTVIELRVVKKGRVGKYTRIRIRQGRVPARLDRCLNPGSSRPRRCR